MYEPLFGEIWGILLMHFDIMCHSSFGGSGAVDAVHLQRWSGTKEVEAHPHFNLSLCKINASAPRCRDLISLCSCFCCPLPWWLEEGRHDISSYSRDSAAPPAHPLNYANLIKSTCRLAGTMPRLKRHKVRTLHRILKSQPEPGAGRWFICRNFVMRRTQSSHVSGHNPPIETATARMLLKVHAVNECCTFKKIKTFQNIHRSVTTLSDEGLIVLARCRMVGVPMLIPVHYWTGPV